MSGYTSCKCRDCMEIAISNDESPDFCLDCEEFGCGEDKECQVPSDCSEGIEGEPFDYEVCGACGFDHEYERELAFKAHKHGLDNYSTQDDGMVTHNPKPRFLESILHYLHQGNSLDAALVWINDGDKARQYPKLNRLLEETFGPRD